MFLEFCHAQVLRVVRVKLKDTFRIGLRVAPQVFFQLVYLWPVSLNIFNVDFFFSPSVINSLNFLTFVFQSLSFILGNSNFETVFHAAVYP